MGCDIHFVVEENDPNTDQWVGIVSTGSALNPVYNAEGAMPILALKHRNYRFFALLAGVRGSGPDANGLPPDASLLTQMRAKEWGGDGHSHGHCSLKEFAEKWVISQFNESEYAQRKLLNTLPTPQSAIGLSADDDLDSYRVCFWFDN